MVTVGQAVVARAAKDPEYKAKVLAKLKEEALDLKARLVKVDRAIKAFKKLKL